MPAFALFRRDAHAHVFGFDVLHTNAVSTNQVSKLALAWDSTIRKEILDKANESLTGDDKQVCGSCGGPC